MLVPVKPEKSEGVRGEVERIILKKLLKLGTRIQSCNTFFIIFFSGVFIVGQ